MQKNKQLDLAGLFGDDQSEASTAPVARSLVVPFGKFKDQPADICGG